MKSTSVLKRQSSTMKKRKRTDKSRYQHESTGDHCTCAAYVAEIMCQRKAECKNQGSLPFKFWNTEPWKHTFRYQVTLANGLLNDKRFSEQALVKAVHSEEFRRANIFSLKHPKAVEIIKKYQWIASQEADSHQDLKVKKNASSRKKTFGKRSQIDKLRSIDLHAEEEE